MEAQYTKQITAKLSLLKQWQEDTEPNLLILYPSLSPHAHTKNRLERCL